MKPTHDGMQISDADFAALVEDLVKTPDTHKVPAREKNELSGWPGPMKSDNVEVL